MKKPALAALLLALAFAPLVIAEDDDDENANKTSIDAMEKRKKDLFERKRYDETGHVRMGRPKPGEWLHRFKESCQDEDDYKKECANKRKKGREKIYVTEWGTLGKRAAAVEPAVRDFLAAFFQLEVVRQDPRELPKELYVKRRKQYDGDRLLGLVKKSLPEDALVGVGILDEDIFTQGLNFIFGQGSLSERAGVYSFRRFDEPEADDTLYRKRCFRLVSHEIGHVLSLEHCVYYECVMNGANSLDEDDQAPLHLCPVCHAKLAWNVGFDDAKREKDLVAILEREKVADELAWHKARLARVTKKPDEKKPDEKKDDEKKDDGF